jgi:hypothetical protein
MSNRIISDPLKKIIEEKNKELEESGDSETLKVRDSQFDKIEDLEDEIEKFNNGEVEGKSRYVFVKEMVDKIKDVLERDPDLSDDDYRKLEKEITYEVRDL